MANRFHPAALRFAAVLPAPRPKTPDSVGRQLPDPAFFVNVFPDVPLDVFLDVFLDERWRRIR